MNDEWLTVGDCARDLKSGKRVVYNAIHHRELRAASINDRGDLRVHRDWLREWMERRAAKA